MSLTLPHGACYLVTDFAAGTEFGFSIVKEEEKRLYYQSSHKLSLITIISQINQHIIWFSI